MAEDWYADVDKHAPGADALVVRKIVTHCGIALRNRDSSLVSFDDPAELGRVRERFLRKKLALTDGDDMLDRAIAAVRAHMAGDRTKNRVTVYYLLSDWFGKHDLFGGSASGPGSFSFASPAAGASAAAVAPPKPPRARKAAPAAVKTAAPAAAPAQIATAASIPVAQPAPAPALQPLYSAPQGDSGRPMYLGYKDEGGGMVWPAWWALAAFAAALVAAVLLVRPA